MNIKVVLEAKLKESFYREGAFEYQKRLLGRVEIIEVNITQVFFFLSFCFNKTKKSLFQTSDFTL